MKIYVGYFITDREGVVAVMIGKDREEVRQYIIETFPNTHPNCYIEEYNLDEREIIFLD